MHLALYRMPLQLFLQKAPHKSAFLSNPPFLFCPLPTRLFRKEHPFGICHTSRCKNLCTSAKLHAYFFASFALNVFLQKKAAAGKACALPAAAGKEYFSMAARISPCQSFGTPYPMQEDISKLCKSKLSVLCIRRDHRSERNYFAVYTPSRR